LPYFLLPSDAEKFFFCSYEPFSPPPICHWPTSSPIFTHSPLVSPVHLDPYITCYPFARGSLIALMMKAVRTSETSVNINLTTRHYIPEDSKLHSSNNLIISSNESLQL
jgi:hypothetical protein